MKKILKTKLHRLFVGLAFSAGQRASHESRHRHQGRPSFGCVVCAGAILLLAATLNAQTRYNYTTLSVPGANTAKGTSPYGISGNNIVGTYENGSGNYYGFLYNGSSYTTLSVPGAVLTEAYAISNNNVVGTYENGSGDYYGFLYNGSRYITLIVPGAEQTWAYGISGNDIVGVYYNGSIWQGFLYNGSSYTTISVPGAEQTWAYGVSGNNIVGAYEDGSGDFYGFLYDGTNYTNLSVPGAGGTYAYGISGNNIVGVYGNGSGDYYGFLYNGSSYATLSVPGAEQTWAYAISGNDIVGSYYNGSNWTGFLATPAHPAFNSIVFNKGNLMLGGTNGTPSASYRALASTSLTLPLTSWTPILTNSFDANGNFQFTNAVNLTNPTLFFDIVSP